MRIVKKLIETLKFPYPEPIVKYTKVCKRKKFVMDKINSFHSDNIKRVENKEIKKDDNAPEKENKTYTGDLSEQMAYLGAINRIKLQPAEAAGVSETAGVKDGTAINNPDIISTGATSAEEGEKAGVIKR